MLQNTKKGLILGNALLLCTLPLSAQFSQVTDSLSTGRTDHAAAGAGSQILFAGGQVLINGTVHASDRVDLFDVINGTHTAASLSVARWDLAATSVGGKALFAGGRLEQPCCPALEYVAAVDLYESSTGTWSTASLSSPRYDLAAASANGLALFAGGLDAVGLSMVVDQYDSDTGLWSTFNLSQPRTRLAGAAAGDWILFAGGSSPQGLSDRVDLYQTTTGIWTTATLSEPRTDIAATAVGNRIFFAGGFGPSGFSDRVDVYEADSGLWSTLSLPTERTQLAAMTVGDYALFGGGHQGFGGTPLVDLYHSPSQTWSTLNLTLGRVTMGAAVLDTAMFGGGNPGTPSTTSYSNVVDVFEAFGVGDPLCEVQPNSLGVGAAIQLSGTKLAGDPLFGICTDGVPGQFGYFLSSPTSGYAQPVLSAGQLCLASPVFRYTGANVFAFDVSGTSQVGAGGPSTLATDGSTAPSALIGESRVYQAWYRDNPPSLSNFSDSQTVTFR